ncbi:MAG TPA: SRPBCC family protein [Solirubrobacteraceae bacterium]|nr:SRPBCC family protein [Solirubrobacteraceae bacterium]
MRTVVARQLLPGATVAEAEALWLERNRWPSFIDGFGVMSIYHGDWPEPGSRVVWDSTPGGRGRVAEEVVDYEPGALLRSEVEDPQLIGTQGVSFHAVEGGAEIRLELSYELKRRGVVALVTDLFFVRRAIGDALRRTLRRFAVELQADREMT